MRIPTRGFVVALCVTGVSFYGCIVTTPPSDDPGSSTSSSGGTSTSGGSSTGGVPELDGGALPPGSGSSTSSGSVPDGGTTDGATGSDGNVDGSVDGGDAGTVDPPAPPPPPICGLECGPGKKVCGGDCVGVDDPAYGCGAGCSNTCPRNVAHATGQSYCAAGACVAGGDAPACKTGWGNCDGDWANGCEADLSKPATCGACGNACAAGEVCNGGVCAAACTPPLDDCGDGACRDFATDPRGCNCKVCPDTAATATCAAGACGLGACDPGFRKCGSPSKCYDTQNDPVHCGASCGLCRVASPDAAGMITPEPYCSAGACRASCPLGYIDCPTVAGGPMGCFDAAADSKNCGGCGIACGAGSACIDGACRARAQIELATGFITLAEIAVDASNVYVTDSGGPGKVWQVAKATGAKTQIATLQAGVGPLAIDASYIYWGDSTGIRRAPIGGGAPQTLSSFVTKSIAVDDTYLYYTADTAGISRLPKGGGAPAVVTAKAAFSVHVDATNIHAWWHAKVPLGYDGWFYRIDKATNAQSFYVNAPSNSRSVFGTAAVDASSVGHHIRTQLTNQSLTTPDYPGKSFVLGGPSPAVHLAVDDCGFFYTTKSSGVHKLARGTEVPVKLTDAATKAGRLVLDADDVYWADETYIGKVSKRRTVR